jgi:hypothetical protein
LQLKESQEAAVLFDDRIHAGLAGLGGGAAWITIRAGFAILQGPSGPAHFAGAVYHVAGDPLVTHLHAVAIVGAGEIDGVSIMQQQGCLILAGMARAAELAFANFLERAGGKNMWLRDDDADSGLVENVAGSQSSDVTMRAVR